MGGRPTPLGGCCFDCTYPMRRLGHSVWSFSLPPHLHSFTNKPSPIGFAGDGDRHSARDPTTARAGRTNIHTTTDESKEVVNTSEGTRPSLHLSVTSSLPLSAETNQQPVEPTNPASFVSRPATPPSGALGSSGYLNPSTRSPCFPLFHQMLCPPNSNATKVNNPSQHQSELCSTLNASLSNTDLSRSETRWKTSFASSRAAPWLGHRRISTRLSLFSTNTVLPRFRRP